MTYRKTGDSRKMKINGFRLFCRMAMKNDDPLCHFSSAVVQSLKIQQIGIAHMDYTILSDMEL